MAQRAVPKRGTLHTFAVRYHFDFADPVDPPAPVVEALPAVQRRLPSSGAGSNAPEVRAAQPLGSVS
jgi:hypothetical protein